MITNMQEKINVTQFIWKFAKKHKIALFVLLALYLVYDVCGVILTPYMNKSLIVEASSQSPKFSVGLVWIIAYAVVSSLVYLFKSLFFRIRFNAVNKVQKEMREDLFYYTSRQSMNYFNNSFSGTLNNRIDSLTRDTETIIDTYIRLISVMFVALISLVIYAKINIPIAVCFAIIFIIYFLATFHARKSMNRTSKILSETKSQLFGLLNDDFMNISNIKLFSTEKKEFDNIKASVDKTMSAMYNRLKSLAIFNAIACIIQFIYIFTILGITAYLLMIHKINIADFMFLMIMTSILRFGMDEITRLMAVLIELKGKMENNIENLMKPLEIENKNGVGKLWVGKGKIVFKNISFVHGGKNV